MKVITAIAYAPKEYDKNLGQAYNEVMESTNSDYVIFLDHDAMFTTRDWYHQICTIIDENPEVGLFSAMTNRIGNKQQLAAYPGHNYLEHRVVGKNLADEHGTEVVDLIYRRTKGWRMMSGVLMVVKREAWEKVKFTDGFLGVDNNFHRDMLEAGYPCKLMRGVYLYHFYRGDGDESHLK